MSQKRVMMCERKSETDKTRISWIPPSASRTKKKWAKLKKSGSGKKYVKKLNRIMSFTEIVYLSTERKWRSQVIRKVNGHTVPHLLLTLTFVTHSPHRYSQSFASSSTYYTSVQFLRYETRLPKWWATRFLLKIVPNIST